MNNPYINCGLVKINMHLPPLPWSSHTHVYVQGDVSIDPTAAISSGVILRADPDSRIIIAAGVCIGSGSILHAHQGILEVDTGANLGAGVLIVGHGKIGTNACIGPLTTLWNASVEPWQVVPAASLLGDRGRDVVGFSPVTPASSPPKASETEGPPVREEAIFDEPVPSAEDTVAQDSPTQPQTESSTSADETPIYGQGSLDRILKTLFPYNQSVNRPPEEG